MPPRQSRPPTLESLLPPILSNLTPPNPNPYSAHQKALTTTARLGSSGHYELAITIAFESAKELLKLGEAGSGVELGVRMIGFMGDSEVGVTDASRANVTQLLALTPAAGPWRKKLADCAVKWSTCGGCPSGDPALHQYLGEMYYKERLFVPAETHLLASGKRDSASLLADLMFEWSAKGTHDPAPYALRITLPYLSQSPPNILPALTFLTKFLTLLASPGSACKDIFVGTIAGTASSITDIHLTTNPTLNFLQLALLTVQRAPAQGVSGVQARGMDGGIGKEWEGLVRRYMRVGGSAGLLGQGAVQEALAQISHEVFLIPQRGGGGGNDMLQNLMGSLFGGGGGGGGGQRGIGAR